MFYVNLLRVEMQVVDSVKVMKPRNSALSEGNNNDS